MTSDIRKWFMKQHDKGNGAASKAPAAASSSSKTVEKDEEDDKKRKKTSKYFPAKPKEEPKEEKKTPPKRKPLKVKEESDDDNDFEVVKGKSAKKKLKVVDVSDEDDDEDMEEEENLKARGRGGGVRGRGGGRGGKTPEKKLKVEELLDEEDDEDVEEKGGNSKGRGGGGAGRGRGRGRGGGRGGFMNFGERKDPPHKGEKDVPEGAPNCLTGLTFVISGTLDSLEREEAEDLIKRHGGRVTGSVSKKTNFLLADEDIGGRKSAKAKELGTSFLTEDGLFDMIRKSKPIKTPVKEASTKKSPEKLVKIETKDDRTIKSVSKVPPKISISPIKRKVEGTQVTWTEKYKPAVPSDIVGNQSLVKQLHEWLAHWDEQFLHTSQKEKGKKKSDANSKKAVLLSGSPGIGKTTSAKLVSKMLGFQAIEVNASDNRGKADAKIFKGVGGSAANSIKELISNESINVGNDWSKHQKTVLIMDEVDGMSAGDRGGVADLIASIKVSKIPIICICNDRYSQKLKSLVNYCLPLNYRKPTKQQMAKRLSYIAKAEGIQVNEIALEELADRVNGDMRMAINQLQYMSLSLPVINYDDVRARLLNSAKDEDISPFSAVDKLFGFNGGKLRMDERIDLSMSDPDLVPLIIQENYINYRPVSGGRDDNGVKRMNMLAKAAESIGDGDLINVQIRRYRQWQLMQSSSIASCIIPASLMHGNRETLEQGERNYNRFGGWLGKNSTRGKNLRLLEDVHVHFLASQHSSLDRDALRVDYFPLLLTQMTHPLREMAKEKAVHNVVEFMDTYSLNLEDFDSIIELSKFQGHTSPLDGVPPAVKGALTRAYKEGSSCRVIRSADMVNIPGVKKAPKKRIAAMLEEPADLAEEKNEEELASDADDADEAEDGELDKLRSDLQSVKSKGIVVDLELKGSSGSLKKSTGAKTSRAESAGKSGGGARGGKRKR